MYYNIINAVIVIDVIDYFLMSVLPGSIIASRLKSSRSKKASMAKLKNNF